MMLEGEIEETKEWWKDAALMKEFDKRYTNWESGKEKAYTLEDTEANIQG